LKETKKIAAKAIKIESEDENDMSVTVIEQIKRK